MRCKTLLLFSFSVNHEWTVVKTSHVKMWLRCFLVCLAGSDCLLTSECSLTRTSGLRAVSPMYVCPLAIVNDGACFCLLT